MENIDNNTNLDYGKCPYHAQLNNAAENSKAEEINANMGNLDEQRSDAGTDPKRYENLNSEETNKDAESNETTAKS